MSNEWKKHPLFQNYSGHSNGLVRNDKTKKELKGCDVNKAGYRVISCVFEQKFIKIYFHVFIYECFHGKVDSSIYDIDHDDNDSTNNRLDNLRKMLHADHTRKTIQASKKTAQAKRIKKISKTVIKIQYDSNGVEIQRTTFSSMNEAISQCKISARNIRKFCRDNKIRNGVSWMCPGEDSISGEYWCSLLDTRFRGIEVSNLGRINNHRKVKSFGSKKKCGYVRINIKGKSYSVHYLVCLAFHGRPPTPYHSVNHIDEIKNNNSAHNLEWLTPKQQADHSYSKKVKAIDVNTQIVIGTWLSGYAAARELGVNSRSISNACTGKNKSKIHHGLLWSFV